MQTISDTQVLIIALSITLFIFLGAGIWVVVDYLRVTEKKP